jgi:glycosyltransferase involved in cell wall biosynthesis
LYHVLSNLPGLLHPRISRHEVIATGGGLVRVCRSAISTAWRARTADAVLLNCAVTDALILCGVLRLLRSRCRVIVSDPVMNPPHGVAMVLRSAVKRWLLRRVDLFLVHQVDLAEYGRLYGITPGRSAYVPFKVNLLDTIRTIRTEEGDYIFSCGVTNRDWPTLGAATRDLPYRLIVSMPDAQQLARMGAVGRPPRPADFGANATIVANGSDPREWLSLAARSRFVVLPVTRDAINPSGVSTYLSLMALGKCVVISDGPATRGILTDQAVIVPAGDADALRVRLEALWNDAARREVTAARGAEYARSLGASDRLLADLASHVVALLERGAGQARASALPA